MKKGLKKAMKSKKRKRNCAYDLPSSSDSDYKQEAGCRDTEHVVDKRLKLDEPFLSDSKSAQPCPINVTDQIPISNNRADEKALEIAKTGKVTAVVAVMHLYGNTKSNLITTSANNSAKKTKSGSNLKKLGLNQSKKRLKRPSRHQKTPARD